MNRQLQDAFSEVSVLVSKAQRVLYQKASVLQNGNNPVLKVLFIDSSFKLLVENDNGQGNIIEKTLADSTEDAIDVLSKIIGSDTVMIAVPVYWAEKRATDTVDGQYPTRAAVLIHDECKRALAERDTLINSFFS